jgi:hypothetical protein
MTHPVSMGGVDDRGATTAPGSLTFSHGPAAWSVRDNAPRDEGRARQTGQGAGSAQVNIARH